MEDTKGQLTKTVFIALGISTILILLIVLQHNLAFQTSSTIVLPAGGTYLGPSSRPSAATTPVVTSASTSGFVTVKGRTYPYSLEVPATLKLVTFPNDAFDIYAIAINNQPPEQNVLIGVDDLNRTEDLKTYIKGNKRAYVENWWKQFGGLKGVSSITPFTNTAGLTGYKAKFLNNAGQTPNDDIFFETPNAAYVIHLANGPLPQATFDAIVDSVTWEK